MGAITDKMVVDAVSACGTATPPMIYDYIEGQYKLPRPMISRNVGRKLKQLVKYRMICSMEFEKRTWYYMPDTIPDPILPKPVYGADKIRQHVNNLPNGGSISVKEAVNVGGCGKSQAMRVLGGMKGLRHDCKANVYYKECI